MSIARDDDPALRALRPLTGTRPRRVAADHPSVPRASRPRLVVLREVRDGLVEVRSGAEAIGFVERAGRVFVALSGERYDRAVEVAQCLSLDDASAALLAASAT